MVNGLQLSTSPQIADAACVSGPASLGRRVVIAIIKIEYVVERGIYEPFDRVGDGAVRTSHSSQLHLPAPSDEDVLQVFRNAASSRSCPQFQSLEEGQAETEGVVSRKDFHAAPSVQSCLTSSQHLPHLFVPLSLVHQ